MNQQFAGIALIVAAAFLQGCERAKTELDREVDRLCAIDGGIRIYETVRLSKESFGLSGEVFPQYRGLPLGKGRLGADYYITVDEHVLIDGDPSLRKSVTAIVRRYDSKVLGSSTNYSRRGGDAPGPWHGSARTCQNVLSAQPGLESSVFVPQDVAELKVKD